MIVSLKVYLGEKKSILDSVIKGVSEEMKELIREKVNESESTKLIAEVFASAKGGATSPTVVFASAKKGAASAGFAGAKGGATLSADEKTREFVNRVKKTERCAKTNIANIKKHSDTIIEFAKENSTEIMKILNEANNNKNQDLVVVIVTFLVIIILAERYQHVIAYILGNTERECYETVEEKIEKIKEFEEGLKKFAGKGDNSMEKIYDEIIKLAKEYGISGSDKA